MLNNVLAGDRIIFVYDVIFISALKAGDRMLINTATQFGTSTM